MSQGELALFLGDIGVPDRNHQAPVLADKTAWAGYGPAQAAGPQLVKPSSLLAAMAYWLV